MKAYRNYRYFNDQSKIRFFTVKHFETDIQIGVDHASYKLEMEHFVLDKITQLRKQILLYNQFVNPDFIKTFYPLAAAKEAPEIVQLMCESSMKAGIGPMASVAGAFAEIIGKVILNKFSIKEILIENGGDLFIHCREKKVLALYAGKSVFSNKLGVKIPAKTGTFGVATSSASVGHSFSLGKADAVTVICKSSALADAFATAFCNEIHKREDIEQVIHKAKLRKEILGIIIVKSDTLGCYGDFEVVSLHKKRKQETYEDYS
jgi:ApbE superfamily uncharacterized protein (UPF0280 family)